MIYYVVLHVTLYIDHIILFHSFAPFYRWGDWGSEK